MGKKGVVALESFVQYIKKQQVSQKFSLAKISSLCFLYVSTFVAHLHLLLLKEIQSANAGAALFLYR